MLLPSPAKIIRPDGSLVPNRVGKGALKEVLEVFKLYKDKRVLLLLPSFICSYFYLSWQSICESLATFSLILRLVLTDPSSLFLLRPLPLLQRPHPSLLLACLPLRRNHLLLRDGILPRPTSDQRPNPSRHHPGDPVRRRDGSLGLGHRRREGVPGPTGPCDRLDEPRVRQGMGVGLLLDFRRTGDPELRESSSPRSFFPLPLVASR